MGRKQEEMTQAEMWRMVWKSLNLMLGKKIKQRRPDCHQINKSYL